MINFDNSDDADEQCSMVIVTLKNGALDSQRSMQGIYLISDQINGKPSWTSVSNAIWYSLSFGWLIGPQYVIGEDLGFIYAADDYGGLDDTLRFRIDVPAHLLILEKICANILSIQGNTIIISNFFFKPTH